MPMRSNSITVMLLWVSCIASLATASTLETDAVDSCVTCHAALPDELAEPVEGLKDDIHAEHGLSCADCHGGNPQAMDLSAMAPERGYLGKPSHQQIPDMCGRCHSDPAYMRRFNPALPTDQRDRYWTSIHGKRLKEGDQHVATCASCHGAHGIHPSNRADSPAYPVNVPSTCGGCHSDQALMAPYGIPTDQEAKYRGSVHGMHLFEKRDLSAPTCVTCHDKHGASPPDVTSVDGVCGMCHVTNTALFVQSPHKKAFDEIGLPECAVCHGKHDVKSPTDVMIGVEGEALCGACHASGSKGFDAALRMRGRIEDLKAAMAEAEASLVAAERLGMEVSDPRYEFHATSAMLIKARTAVHRFSTEYVDEVAGPGVELAVRTRQVAEAAVVAGYARRWQLLLPLAIIGLVIALLVLKLRRLESAGGG